jgi:transposase-like protein
MAKKSKPNNVPQAAYNQEFKETAIQLALAGDKPVSIVARELSLPEWKLRDWLRAWKKKNSKVDRSANGKGTAEDELRKLQKRYKELELENEILKKASAYFARTLL